MPRLTEIVPNSGVPQDNYIVVPYQSYNVVRLEGAKGGLSYSHDSKVTVQKVTRDNAGKIAESISRNHASGHKSGGDYHKELLAQMQALVSNNPGQTLAIYGRKPGFGKLTVTADGSSYKAEVGVTQQATVNIGFRFLQHTDGKGKVADTAYTPNDAAGWIVTLNRIYGPQANLIFDLVDAEWVTLDSAPSQPIGKDLFLKSIAVTPQKKNVNMHLVGRWEGTATHSRGTYFNGTGVAVITDKPGQNEIPKGIDPFMLTMAHELLHFIRERRGMPEGHPSRDGILLSSKIQSLRIDKQMSIDINPPG